MILDRIKLKIKGNIDRLQSKGAFVDIIDYKTGAMDKSDLTLKNIEEAFTGKKNKAFQLLYYALLYNNQNLNSNEKISTGIIHLKKINKHLQYLNITKDDHITSDKLMEFKDNLSILINEIQSDKVPFTHLKEAKYCKYCE